jgi:hypothetical protein
MDQKIIDFLKGIMQPAITIAMVIVFVSFALAGKFTSDQVWQIVVGIIVFWFGYTAFKFGTGGIASTETPTDTTNSLVKVIAQQTSALDNAAQNLAESVPVSATPSVTSTVAAGTGDTIKTTDPDPDAYLKEIN